FVFFFSSRRRHTRFSRDWSSDVCSSDLQSLQESLNNINVLAVKDVKTDEDNSSYYKPSQVNIAKKLYPLTREVYLLNYQGTTGLGMGFASFVAGDVGQRIILTSGLAPLQLEPMKIKVTKEFNK